MSITEIIKFRIPQFIQTQILSRFQKNRRVKIDQIYINENYKIPNYSLNIIEELLENFTFQYKIFNIKINLLSIDNWRKEFKINKTSKLKFYGKIDRQNHENHGDVKYLSEISRLHFLPFIAFKHILGTDKKSGNFITTTLVNWSIQNPYLNSINWTSGIEVGIRSVNLIYTHQVLNSRKMLTKKQDYLIKQQIELNYHYLKNHLSLYSSANNHLIAELIGLVAISNYFSFQKFNAEKWNNYFFKEFLNQINIDGIDMELSTRYHAAVIEHFLNGFEFIKNAGLYIPKDIETRFKEAFKFINHSVFNKSTILFGDDDNSKLVYPFFDDEFSIYASLLQSSNHLFNTKYNNHSLDCRNYLIFGNNINNIKATGAYQDKIFLDSGYCFMYDDNFKLSFDVGKIGDDLMAAHGHSDLLHFTFESDDSKYIVDSGTFQYHKNETVMRNYFKGISAHNTLSINNKHHSISNGRMGWKTNPNVTILDYNFDTYNSFCYAKHDAFIKEGVVHKRRIELDRTNKKVAIFDELILENNHKNCKVDFYLHFHPTLKVEHIGNIIKLVTNSKKEMILENSFFNQAKIINGCMSTPLGWYSKSFDKIQSTSTLRLKLKLEKNMTLITTINYFSA